MTIDPHQRRRFLARARRALAHFPLPPPYRLRFIHHGENTTVRVWDGEGASYLLRLCRIGYQSPRALRSEMQWLDALAVDLPGRAPRPVFGSNGDLVQRIPLEEGGHQSVVLLHWLHARFSNWNGSPRFYQALGALTAALHDQAITYRPPGGTGRVACTPDRLVGPGCRWGTAPWDVPVLTASQRSVYKETCAAILERLEALPRGRAHWGMIHADLHLANTLWRSGEAVAIDFDDCGPGWFIMDPAISLIGVRNRSHYADLEAAWLRGYRAHRPLDDQWWEEVPTFTLARHLHMVSWLWSRRDVPALEAMIPGRAARVRRMCLRWLKTSGREFLPPR